MAELKYAFAPTMVEGKSVHRTTNLLQATTKEETSMAGFEFFSVFSLLSNALAVFAFALSAKHRMRSLEVRRENEVEQFQGEGERESAKRAETTNSVEMAISGQKNVRRIRTQAEEET